MLIAREPLAAGCMLVFYQPSQPGGGQSTATPLGGGCCWQLDTAHCERGSVIVRVLDPKVMPVGPNWILPKSAPWHFVQLVPQAQLLSTEDSIGAEAPIPPIPPAQQEKREVPLGGRHRCSMDWSWTIDLVQLGIWQSLNEIMTLLESKQDPAEGPKVYKEMVCMTKNSGKVTKRSWRQWRLKQMLGQDSSIRLFVKVGVSILRWPDHK